LATTSCLTRCVIGDFNLVRNDSERKGMNNGKVNRCEIARFNKFIENCSLKEKVSDHCALVVKNSTIDWGPKPFKTFDVWQQADGFKEVVRKAWDNVVVCGNSLEDI